LLELIVGGCAVFQAQGLFAGSAMAGEERNIGADALPLHDGQLLFEIG
jgi:hypothetical protein